MEISLLGLLTVLHGIGFGALFMLAFSGAVTELYRISVLRLYLGAMVVLAWATVLSGAYLIYPWYRAAPPAGVIDLANYPKYFLIANPRTSGWHNLGMEWKEHVAWLAPIAMTMVAYVFGKYGAAVTKQKQIRMAVLAFAVVAFVATGVAGAFGAYLSKYAPVRGGPSIQIMQGEQQ